jgi:prepilin-type N-terminal cleavage/methylation domain-containing protein
MKKTGHLHQRHAAFTLIELLIVVAIIAILAALIIPIAGAVNAKKQISVAQTQLKALEMAIDGYKTKLGYYPPDNTNNPAVNQLYFELMGTVSTNTASPTQPPNLWVTLDGSAQIGNGGGQNIFTIFGVTSLANAAKRAHSDDTGAAAQTFLNNLTPNQVGLLDPSNPNVKLLVCSVPWPTDKTPPPIPTNPQLNPFNYMSSHPTNNTGSYDLWVDLIIKGKTNRVCNWSTQPIKL